MILRPPPIGWKPHPGSQIRFLHCPVFECLLEGTRGGGKTDALLMSFAQFVGKGFGAAWRGILFREEYPQLEDVVAKSKRWFMLLFPGAKFNESDYVWIFPDGERLYLRHGRREEDYWKYHGHEYPCILFEELTNWRDLAFYEMMQSCCRSSHPGMPRMVRATCNPYGRGHTAVKERFQISDDPRENEGLIIRDKAGRERTYVHSDIGENDALLTNDPDYLKTLEGTKDPNRRKAWLLGRWDINIGAFLEGAWKPDKHIVEPFRIPSHWNVWQAMDWGFGKPYAVYWFAKDPEGLTYIWRELYGCAIDDEGKLKPNVGVKESPKTVAERIKTREAHDERLGIETRLRLTGPDLFARGGAQYGTQITHGQVFRGEGVSFRPWWAGPGSRKAGAMLVRQMFEEDQVRVFSSCVHWIRTVPTLEPDPEDPDDVDTEGEDHCFTADTLVRTSRGFVPIHAVRDGDVVLNHEGRWVRTLGARLTRRNAEVVRLTLANGRTITCTPDHRFYMGGSSFCPAKDLLDAYCYGLMEAECKSPSSATPSKNSRACGTTDAASTSSARVCGCTARCGSGPMGATSRPTTTCTTPTRTGPTTSRETSNCCTDQPTTGTTWRARGWLSTFRSWAAKLPRLGTPAPRGASGTASTTPPTETPCMRRCSTPASSAVCCSSPARGPSAAPRHVAASSAERVGPTACSGTASTAAPSSHPAARTVSGFARARVQQSTGALRVLRIEPAGRADVWCMEVPDGSTFTLAAGPIVHNCFDATKAGLMRRTSTPDEPQKPDEGGAVVLADGMHVLPNAARPRKG